MPRKPNPVPSYRLHKSSGQARVRVRQPDGRYRDVLLGRYGGPESRAEYARLVAGLQASPVATAVKAGRPGRAAGATLTVNEVVLAFLTHADAYYGRPAGHATGEAYSFRLSLRPVRELCGHTPAAEFGPLALKAVRQRMVDSGLCRTVVNARVGRVKRMFKWAASEELVPFGTYHALTAVAGLGKGRTPAREPDPVRPVDAAAVSATLPHLPPVVRAMVQFQRFTGCRPGEACRLRPADLDRSGPVWVYAPERHKGAWRGTPRRVRVGPRAQAVLAPLLAAATDPTRPLFSPAVGEAVRHAARRLARKTKVQPSQRDRTTPGRKRPPGAAYDPRAYAQAVKRAVGMANRRRERLAGAGHFDPVPHWHPNQLRHSHATAVRRLFGLEAAGAALGHAKMSATEIYAEKDESLAERVAAELG